MFNVEELSPSDKDTSSKEFPATTKTNSEGKVLDTLQSGSNGQDSR
jgi:hypothetical protein